MFPVSKGTPITNAKRGNRRENKTSLGAAYWFTCSAYQAQHRFNPGPAPDSARVYVRCRVSGVGRVYVGCRVSGVGCPGPGTARAVL